MRLREKRGHEGVGNHFFTAAHREPSGSGRASSRQLQLASWMWQAVDDDGISPTDMLAELRVALTDRVRWELSTFHLLDFRNQMLIHSRRTLGLPVPAAQEPLGAQAIFFPRVGTPPPAPRWRRAVYHPAGVGPAEGTARWLAPADARSQQAFLPGKTLLEYACLGREEASQRGGSQPNKSRADMAGLGEGFPETSGILSDGSISREQKMEKVAGLSNATLEVECKGAKTELKKAVRAPADRWIHRGSRWTHRRSTCHAPPLIAHHITTCGCFADPSRSVGSHAGRLSEEKMRPLPTKPHTTSTNKQMRTGLSSVRASATSTRRNLVSSRCAYWSAVGKWRRTRSDSAGRSPPPHAGRASRQADAQPRQTQERSI